MISSLKTFVINNVIIIPIYFIITIFIPQNSLAVSPSQFSTEKAGFRVNFKNETSPYRVLAVFTLPDYTTTFEILDHKTTQKYKVKSHGGSLTQIERNKWAWKAPSQKGLFPLTIINAQSTDSMKFNIFVMTPYYNLVGEYLNGYRIGKYPAVPFKQLPIYKPPIGFVEVTEENEETFVSPHFQLKQFVCKQKSGYPKYLFLRERLLLKLELILESTNKKGYPCETFHIMSGYRTPYYNKAIGNVRYSRHVWGGAADIFIDENPKDNMMDDLNKDGKIDYHDAGIIYSIIDEMYGKLFYVPFWGGLGRYKKTASHGPFVHVDVRGFRARWGR